MPSSRGEVQTWGIDAVRVAVRRVCVRTAAGDRFDASGKVHEALVSPDAR